MLYAASASRVRRGSGMKAGIRRMRLARVLAAANDRLVGVEAVNAEVPRSRLGQHHQARTPVRLTASGSQCDSW